MSCTYSKTFLFIYDFWDFDNNANLTKNELIEKNIKAYIDAADNEIKEIIENLEIL